MRIAWALAKIAQLAQQLVCQRNSTCPSKMTSADGSPLTQRERITHHLFLLAVFCVPFSTALMHIFAVLTLLGFIVALWSNPALRRPLRSPPALLALALLLLLVAGTSWSIAPLPDIETALRKYAKLLVLPIAICLGWRIPGLGARSLRYALAGSAVLATATYLVWLGWMPTSKLGWWSVGAASDPVVFRNHITIGILLGFAANVCLLAATYRKTTRARLLAVSAGIYFSVPTVYLLQGRTGYVTLFIGLVIVFLLRTRMTPLRTVSGLAAITLLFVGFYAVSPNFKTRTDALVTDVRSGDERSPNGLRMSFMRVGVQAVATSPLIGLGTGSFAEAYAPTAERVWASTMGTAIPRHQPHSEFLLIATQLGLAGFAIYLGMLATLGRAALAGRSFETDVFMLLWVIYVVASTFNSLIWDPTEGYWFLLLSGSLYADCMRRRPVAPQPVKGVIADHA
jgi:O-antigen ligase